METDGISRGGRFEAMTAARRSMPGVMLTTTIVFAALAFSFTLAMLLHLLVEEGTLAAGTFFAALALACAVAAAGLFQRRPWAAPLVHVLAGLLAAAALGMFGAITLVGAALLAWVLYALNARRSREWLAAGRRR